MQAETVLHRKHLDGAVPPPLAAAGLCVDSRYSHK